jgi:prepilin signal peptidase PulO-like enzyme (type II secretory pathway)
MVIGNKIFKKESLGGGDIKMMFVFGILLEPLLGAFAIFLGSVLALPISIILLKKKIGNIVPFGPFLLIALTFIFFTGLTTDSIIDFIRML